MRRIPRRIRRLKVRNYAVLVIAPRDPGYTYLKHLFEPEVYYDYRMEGLTVNTIVEHALSGSRDKDITMIKPLVETSKGIYLFMMEKGRIRLVAAL